MAASKDYREKLPYGYLLGKAKGPRFQTMYLRNINGGGAPGETAQQMRASQFLHGTWI